MIRRALIVCFAFFAALALQAQPTLDAIGVTQLRSLGLGLTGSGVKVAQPEATSFSGNVDQNNFEVNPGQVGQSQSLFTYINSSGQTSGTFPNVIGTESGHANGVGANFYGISSGVAYGVSHVDNYNANRFFNYYIWPNPNRAIEAAVVNQSFVWLGITGTSTATYEEPYDDYAAQRGTIFISGVGNGGSVLPPATCYNGIGVAAWGGGSSVGPTTDGLGRSKPDITAPAGETSNSTPYVAGAAAILVQAGNASMGGAGTAAAATDSRTVKALLLNGAVKQSGWTHNATAVLDTQQGAGLLNIYNSYLQLAAGQHTFTTSNISQTPPTVSGSFGTVSGWDSTLLTSSGTSDQVNHYFFDLSPGQGSSFTVTSTLVWIRQSGQTSINNLDLFLYNAAGTLMASSVSTVDNVEHLFTSYLAPGRYDLEVVKRGGSVGSSGVVSNAETYALAFNFTTNFPLTASISTSGSNATIQFPSIAGHTYRVERNLDLTANSWTTLSDNIPGTGSNLQVVDTNALNEPQQFYRVRLLQ